MSLPAKIVRTDDEVAGIRQAQAEQAAEQQQMIAMAQGVENAQKLGNTPTGEGTALGDLEKEITGEGT